MSLLPCKYCRLTSLKCFLPVIYTLHSNVIELDQVIQGEGMLQREAMQQYVYRLAHRLLLLL